MPTILAQLQTLSMLIGEQANTLDLPNNVRNMIDQGLSSAAAYTIDLAKNMVVAVFSLASQVIELVVIPVLVYYFLKDGIAMQQAVINLFTPGYRPLVRSILQETAVTIGAYIHGQISISIIMAVMVFSGLYIMGVDYAAINSTSQSLIYYQKAAT